MSVGRTTLSFVGVCAALSGALCLGACSAGNTQVEEPVASGSASAGPGNIAGPASYDLSPVSAPANVLVSVHAKSVSNAVAALGGGKGTADALTRNLVQGLFGRSGLRLDVDADKLISQVAMDTPIDFVIALSEDGPEPVMAFAVGLRSLEDGKTALGATTEVGPGVWSFSGEKAKAYCVVEASSGQTPARMVCGQGERDVRALGPWLARGATLLQPVADGTVDVDLKPVNAKFGAQLRGLIKQAPLIAKARLGLDQAQFDKALEDGSTALATEVLNVLADTDTVHFDLGFSSQTGVTLDGTVAFKGKTSWITNTSAKGQNVALPPLFFRAPADADAVTFSRFEDTSDYQGMKKVLKDAIEGALAKFSIGSDAERKRVSGLLDLPINKGSVLVNASGHAKLTKSAPPKTRQEKLNAFLDAQTGWRLFGTNQKAEVITKWLTESVNAYNLPGIQKEIQKQAASHPAVAGLFPVVKTPAAPAKLGKGAFEADITLKFEIPRGGPAAGPKSAPATDSVLLTFYVLVMADGEDSWVAFGGNRDELVERLLMAKSGAPKDKTLDARVDMGMLKTQKAVSQGFLSLGSFEGLFQTLFIGQPTGAGLPEDIMLEAVTRLDVMMQGLPHKAASPITFEGDLKKNDPLVSHFSLNIPLEASRMSARC